MLYAHFLAFHVCFQDRDRNAFSLTNQPQQEVSRPNMVMGQTACLIHRHLDDFLGAWGQSSLPQHHPLTPAYEKLNGTAHFIQFHSEVAQHLCRYPFALPDEAQEQMLGTHIVVVEVVRFFLGETESHPRLFSTSVKVALEDSQGW